MSCGEQIAALPGFGGLQVAQQLLAGLLHLEAMIDEAVGVGGADDEDGDRERGRNHERKTDDNDPPRAGKELLRLGYPRRQDDLPFKH